MSNIIEVPVEAEIVNVLHNLDAAKILEGGEPSLVDAGEFFKNPDTKTMLALNEKIAQRRSFFQEIGNSILQKPERIEYRRPSTLNPVNPMHRQEGFVFIGSQGGSAVEVTIPHHNLQKLTEAASQLVPKISEAITIDSFHDNALTIEIPVTDEILKIVAARNAEPEDIQKLRVASNPTEGSTSLELGQIQRYEETSRKDHGSMTVQVIWDDNHHESMDITDVTEPGGDTYRSPTKRTRFTQLRWGASVAHHNSKNNHAPITTVFVTTQNEKMPQLEITEEHGDLSVENGKKTTQHVVETLVYPYNAQGGVLHKQSFDRYYPKGGTPNRWVSESGFVAYIEGDKKGWNVVHAHRYDYQKNLTNAEGTGTQDYKDRSSPISDALLKEHMGLAQAGIKQGGNRIRDINKALKMAVGSIPQ